MEKIKLEVAALSHSITHSHSYAVVLGEKEGPRRLPVVIGAFEAQAIAIALEKMSPSRPLTHDLMKNLSESFNIELKEVIINNLSDGIFYSQLICKRNDKVLEVDSRTSDALALALRFDCPIYTYEFIMDSAGIVFEEGEEESVEGAVKKSAKGSSSKKSKKKGKKKDKPSNQEDLKDYSLKELNKMLDEALEKEDYETAILIRDEIERRKKDS